MIFAPGEMDNQRNLQMKLHSMQLYEANLEGFLSKRRVWLWKKAVFMARLVVKLSFSRRLEQPCESPQNYRFTEEPENSTDSVVDGRGWRCRASTFHGRNTAALRTLNLSTGDEDYGDTPYVAI